MKLKHLIIIGFSVFTLSACGNAYKVEVDLPQSEVESIEKRIERLKEDIANYLPSDEGSIAWEEIIALASAYEELGEIGKAIDLYEDVLEDEHKTKAILNNLGRLYEKTEQYALAIAMYQRIHDEYFDRGYLYDITWAYIKAGDRKNAEKYFNAWQLEFNKTDEQTQQAIKKLREKEKAQASE